MSEVISFRLDKDNPREAQARAVLKARVDKGYSIRHVLTEALLSYQGSHRELNIHELSVKLDQISKLIQQNGNPPVASENNRGLSDQFLASIRTAAKQGVRINN
jgi:hypothetical protein